MATTSKKFSLDWQDALKGLLMATLSPVLIILTQLAGGNFNINWTETWHVAVAAGAAYLLKNYFSGPSGGATPPGLSSLGQKTISILTVGLLLSSISFGQSIFKPLPLTPKKAATPGRAHAIILPTDSTPNISNGKFQGLRFSGPDIAFAIPDFSVYTGLGIDYVSAVADPATGKWAYNFTIGPRVYGGANLGEPTVRAIGAIGIRATFLKGWLALGVLYNLTTQKPQATIGNPAALIPGLN